MKSAQLAQKDALQFITAGKAIFTAKSLNTGKHFTYKVQAPKDQSKEDSSIFWVSVLTGSDNTGDYTFIGSIKHCDNGWNFIPSRKSRIAHDAPSAVAINFIISKLNAGKEIANLELWHEGCCCRCGRKLTTPESVAAGIGPECESIRNKIYSL